MKQILSVISLSIALCVSAIAQNKESRNLDSKINSIEITKGANVSLIQCDKNEIEVVTEGCPTSDVITAVKGDVLNVSLRKRTPGSAVRVALYFTDLQSIKVKRGATVDTECLFKHSGTLKLDVGAQSEAQMDIEVDELDFEGNTCSVKLEGKAKKQKVRVAGTVGESEYNAEDLESEDVDVRATQTDVKVKFSNSLTAEAIACTIRYDGDSSKAHKTEKMGGSVEKM